MIYLLKVERIIDTTCEFGWRILTRSRFRKAQGSWKSPFHERNTWVVFNRLGFDNYFRFFSAEHKNRIRVSKLLTRM